MAGLDMGKRIAEISGKSSLDLVALRQHLKSIGWAMSRIETETHYERLEAMSEAERIEILDPICDAVRGKAKVSNTAGVEVLSNRIFALAVLDLYQQWQDEIYHSSD